MKEAGKLVAVQDVDPITQVIEVDPDITKVERSLEMLRIRARDRCEPGLFQLVRNKQLSPDKEARKLVAYGEVLSMLARGDLRDDDLHAIKVDWRDALSSVGGWQRG